MYKKYFFPIISSCRIVANIFKNFHSVFGNELEAYMRKGDPCIFYAFSSYEEPCVILCEYPYDFSIPKNVYCEKGMNNCDDEILIVEEEFIEDKHVSCLASMNIISDFFVKCLMNMKNVSLKRHMLKSALWRRNNVILLKNVSLRRHEIRKLKRIIFSWRRILKTQIIG